MTSYFSFAACAFVVITKKPLPNPREIMAKAREKNDMGNICPVS